jgi:3-oxoacyl-(acyl-carrier-protein) synthase
MVLGEGAALFAIESEPEQALAWISGIGCAQEVPTSPTSVSKEGKALQRAMGQALQEAALDTVDVVICHAPGTRKGDAAELHAIQSVFGDTIPCLTGNKWKLGHTLGASGALSLEMALLMLQENQVFGIPYLKTIFSPPDQIKTVMINAMGFGGNAVSVIVQL